MKKTNVKYRKRLLAFMLAVIMIISGVPNPGIVMPVQAAEDGETKAEDELVVKLSSENKIYTGENLVPELTVTYEEKDVTINADIVWKKENSSEEIKEIIDAGKYFCSVSYRTGKGSSAKTVTGSADFIVMPKTLTDTMVEGIVDQVYDGKEKRPVVVVDIIKEKQVILTENKDYVASYTANVDAVDKVTAVISGKGNYTGTINRTFRIAPQSLSVKNVFLSKTTGTYTGNSQIIDLQIPFANYQTSYYSGSVSEANQVKEIINVGDYKIKVESQNSNYTGTVVLDYSVLSKSIADKTITIEYDKSEKITYNGKNQKPKVTAVKDGSIKLSEGKDYTVSYGEGNFTDRGSYTVTVNGMGNYSGQVEKIFTIQTNNILLEGTDFSIEGIGYKKGYFRSDVTVKVEGYYLSETESDDSQYKEKLVYSENLSKDKEIYLKDIDTGEIFGPLVLDKEKFTIVRTGTSVNAAVNADEAESWKNEKEIVIESPKKEIDYYYSKKKLSIKEVNSESDLDGLTAVKNGSFKVTDDVGETPVVYNIYAVDEAGNVTDVSVNVKLIDTVKPELQIIKNNEHYDVDNQVFWKNNQSLTVLIATADRDSGMASVKVSPKNGAVVSDDSNYITFSRAGTYIITAEDLAGNSTSINVAIKQDTGVPGISLKQPMEDKDGNKLELYCDGEICWINKDSVRIPFEIRDTEDANLQKSTVKVEYSTDDGISWTVLEKADIENLYKVFEEVDAEGICCLMRISDLAGNVSETREAIKIAVDMEKPQINSVDFIQKNNTGWINAENLGTDAVVEFSVNVQEEDISSGIAQVSYVFSQDENKTADDYATDDFKPAQKLIKDTASNTYKCHTIEKFGTEKYPDGTYYWIIRVTDHVGNYTDYSMSSKIDATQPEETAYARFISDTEGVNKGESMKLDDSWLGKIYSFLSEKWNQICGKKNVEFELYLMDRTSGINDVELTYEANGNQIVLTTEDGSLQVVEGKKAFQEGNFTSIDDEEGYTVITGSIAIKENENLAISDFKLKSVTDKAGNVREDYILNGGGDIVYLDTVAPELSGVTVDGISVAKGGPFYYNETQKMKLEIKERFFEEAIENDAAPVITVYSRESNSDEFEENSTMTQNVEKARWTTEEKNGESFSTAEIDLPVISGRSIEYQIKISFQDPSGNLLEGGDDITGVIDGIYTSQIFAISDVCPELVSFSVEGESDRKSDGIDVYHRGKDGQEDVTVTFSIKDSSFYWSDENIARELIFEIYNLSENAEIAEKVISGDKLTWETEGDIHKASFEFSGNMESAVYRTSLIYRNQFGNKLKLSQKFIDESGQFDDAQGKYTGKKFILDHEKPIWNINYNHAYRLVKNDASDAANDKMNTVPLTGYTAYYNDIIEVTFTIEEKYAVVNDNGSLADFEISIIQDNMEIEELPEISWSQENNIYTGKFVITEEGAYEIKIKYQDAAGNEMTADTEVTGSKTDTLITSEGLYTSTILILDKTAPQLSIKYVDEEGNEQEPVLEEGERKYFNGNVYLQVKADDKNIRYGEFKDAFLKEADNLVACDILGEELESNGVSEFLNSQNFDESIVEHKETTWNIPLAKESNEKRGANYTISLEYEDLAGNCGNKMSMHPTVDPDLPEEDVYICFASDVEGSNNKSEELMDSSEGGWTSKVLNFLSDIWVRIFGRENIRFKVYLKDSTTGIKSIAMEYLQDGETNVSFGTAEGESTKAKLRLLASEKDRKDEELLTGYAIAEGVITVPAGQDTSVEQFKITEITDYVGNERSVDDEGNSYILHDVNQDTDLIYLDCTAPTLNVDYTDDCVFDESRLFYRDSAVISYKLKERFFAENTDNGRKDGNPIEPEVVIQGVNKEKAEVSGWNPVDDENYDAYATVTLPILHGEETEYIYTISYKDAGDNHMIAGESCKGIAENGIYTEKTIVVDNQAPKLMSFEIKGVTTRNVDSVPVYHNDGGSEQNDITIAFTVDDNDSYWNPETLIFEIYNESLGSEEPCVQLSGTELNWETSGRLHSTTYGFDGENEIPAKYYVKIKYTDRAGNNLVSGSTNVNPGQINDGVYISNQFVLDHESPVFQIKYNEAKRVVNNNENIIKDSEVKTPQTDYTSYYNDKIEVEFTIAERFASEKNNELVNQDLSNPDFVLSIKKDDEWMSDEDMPDVTWTKTMVNDLPCYKGQFTLNEDGRYQIKVFYRDMAMNNMIADESAQGIASMSEGTYKSTVLVLDTQAPKVKFKYVDMSSKQEVLPQNIDDSSKRSYFSQPVYLQIEVDDTRDGIAESGNVRYQELKKALILIAKNSSGEEIEKFQMKESVDAINEEKIQRSAFVIELPMTDEVNYDIILENFEDLAGNQVSVMNTKACIDHTKPKVSLSYKTKNQTGYAEDVNYGKNIWFADGTLVVTASLSDASAGVKEIVVTVTDTDDDGRTLYRTAAYNSPETLNWKKEQTFVFEIPLETPDFKGEITATVTDWSNQKASMSHSSMVESQKRHNSTKGISLMTNTKPSRVVNGKEYYNTDINFTVSLKDRYSGIRRYEITPGKDSVVSRDFAENRPSAIQYNFKKNVKLSSKNNNSNSVKVEAKYTDNTHHTETVRQRYNIDITAPIIEVNYNLNNPASEKYYKDTRVATVTIIERNFDPNDVKFSITNTEGTQPVISGWTSSGSGDATRNYCTITYSADGDYTFSVSFQDMAANKATYNRIDEFTIDQTVPTYTVTYDNNDCENEYYYRKERTATIDILEHNFDSSNIIVTVMRNGAKVDMPLSGWSSNGDHNIATVPFDTDGDYTFTISGMDLAQNQMEPYPADHFVIDMTAPELEIQNIEDMSANNNVVAPRIVYNDTNYDDTRTRIIYEGYNKGEIDYTENGTVIRSEKGAIIEMNDVERKQENDDIYIMKVTVYDKAGNMSEANKTFSVNRFGSVYTFEDERTQSLMQNGGYTNTAHDIKVTETNVDTLEFQEISCSRDGELLPMNDGEQYEVEESGNEVTWKQYRYTMYKDSFEEEGRYIIKILSKDRATNISDNDTKGKKIEFIMDTTVPSVLISGVEENGRYQTDSQDVTVDAEDNVLLTRVQLYVNDKQVADYSDSKELMQSNLIDYSIAEQDYKQSFEVVAMDAAGNRYASKVSNITINTSWWRLFLANKVLVYGSIAVLLILVGFFWCVVLIKRKKREEKL